jgi:hypothetical protein
MMNLLIGILGEKLGELSAIKDQITFKELVGLLITLEINQHRPDWLFCSKNEEKHHSLVYVRKLEDIEKEDSS